ncbi:MAG: hypothetical protein K2O18_03180 [Oscillospiraceae bacterium]|nr:hypothetical protein [Oscillospiraceae bacterium]
MVLYPFKIDNCAECHNPHTDNN